MLIFSPLYPPFKPSTLSATLALLLFSHTLYAETPLDVQREVMSRSISEAQPHAIHKEVENTPPTTLSTTLPSEKTSENSVITPTKKISKAEVFGYLQQNPAELEDILVKLVYTQNIEGLEELLPIYEKYTNKDQSMVDWGNAILAHSKGDFKSSISLYRKINAALPNIKLLRFQMAVVLYKDRQLAAARYELEKLRSADGASEEDIAIIDQYIAAINKEDDWSFNAGLSFINNKNLTNAPPVGTTLGNWVEKKPHETGKGINFSLSSDKKWLTDRKIFTALHLATFGDYYWDNKKFNDTSAKIGLGLGYQNVRTEVELSPYVSQRWYGGGLNGTDYLKRFSRTKGLNLSTKYWLSPQWLYQASLDFNEVNYVTNYAANDAKHKLLSNTLVYFYSPIQFWFFGLDFSDKKTNDPGKSFNREGVRIGWGQAWPKGFSTRLNLGFAGNNYDGKDFFNVKQHNHEYNIGLSIWNRAFYYGGITPKININYTKIDGNHPFYNYDKADVSLELAKTF